MSHEEHGVWALHVLNRRGQLDGVASRVREAISEVRRRAGEVTRLPALDLVAQASPRVIPEIGHVGIAPRPGVIFLTLDPNNQHLAANLGQSLERMIAHELHHALRWDAVGYGTTLGEAIVSEGLAGHFVRELYGSDPEPWEVAVRGEALAEVARAAIEEQDAAPYHHAAWFFGVGPHPRWAGYALGYALVGRWLGDDAARRASAAAATPASEILPLLSEFAG